MRVIDWLSAQSAGNLEGVLLFLCTSYWGQVAKGNRTCAHFQAQRRCAYGSANSKNRRVRNAVIAIEFLV